MKMKLLSEKLTFVALLMILVSGPVLAEKKAADTDIKTTTGSATNNNRKAESEMYQKMADCLKSDSSYEECHRQMADKSQRLGLGHGMGKMRGKMGPGMMRRGMKGNASEMEDMRQPSE